MGLAECSEPLNRFSTLLSEPGRLRPDDRICVFGFGDVNGHGRGSFLNMWR
jgi:hypothetical protein